ncbi:MAG: F0F1 ATP synthase subunit A [Bifidobacteriaceae bacterium]|jgi:F-type H+-transporting ATPase subunit a|nr:F0F1 ATP synthase subunit A [Bifidobacteriaceae bacterium]
MEVPSISDFLPEPFLFVGTIFELNRLQLIRIMVTLFIIVFFSLVAKKSKIIPGRVQSAVEIVFEFLREQIVYQQIPSPYAKKYISMITTIFCTIFFFNLAGIVPGFNLSASAGIGVPLLFALWVFVQYWKAGIQEHGFFGFLRDELFPKGVPPFVYPLIAPVELAQLLLVKPFSLTIRLLANMISGHMLLALCFLATQFFMFQAGFPFILFSPITFVGAIFFTLFEIFVAALQAYIFALLAAAYIGLSYKNENSASSEAQILAGGAK